MKGKIKGVVAVILIMAIAATVLVACVNTDLSGYSYPEGLEEALSSYDFSRAQDSDVRVASFNMLVHMESWGGTPVPPRAKIFLKVLDEVKPDVIAAQEMSSDWYKVLGENMGDEYVALQPKIDLLNKNKTPVIYNTDTLLLIESGYSAYSVGDENGCRAVTWGLFTVKATGKYVLVTSTHLDLIRSGKEEKELEIMNKQADELLSKIDELYARYSCSIIACGDYNSMESGEVEDNSGKVQGVYAAEQIYAKLSAALTDVKYKEGLCILNSDENKKFAPTWDHIFLKGDAKAEKFYILDNDVFEQMSDHYMIFADFTL